MPPNILFVTQPYSGTRFFLDLVKPVLGTPDKVTGTGPFLHNHCGDRTIPYVDKLLSAGYKLITTHRPQSDIIKSWRNRFGEAKDEQMKDQIINYWEHIYYQSHLVFRLEPSYRDISLSMLNRLLDLSYGDALHTNWKPIGHNR